MRSIVLSLLLAGAFAAAPLTPLPEHGRYPVESEPQQGDITFYPNPESAKALSDTNSEHSVRSGDNAVVLHPVEGRGYNSTGAYSGGGRRKQTAGETPCCRICPSQKIKMVRYNRCYSVCGPQCHVPNSASPCEVGVDCGFANVGPTGQDMVQGWKDMKSTVDMPTIKNPEAKNDRAPVGGVVEKDDQGELALHDPVIAKPQAATGGASAKEEEEEEQEHQLKVSHKNALPEAQAASEQAEAAPAAAPEAQAEAAAPQDEAETAPQDDAAATKEAIDKASDDDAEASAPSFRATAASLRAFRNGVQA